MPLTVAVTGPTGDIGISAVEALEHEPDVERIIGTAASAASEVIARLPFVPSALEWLHAGRTSVVMDTGKAKSQLGWVPKYTAAETLCALGETL
jgi:UDP-glucose 4-epimerase